MWGRVIQTRNLQQWILCWYVTYSVVSFPWPSLYFKHHFLFTIKLIINYVFSDTTFCLKYEQKCHPLFAPCCDTLKCINGVCNEEGKSFSDTDPPVVIQKSCQEMRINHFSAYILSVNPFRAKAVLQNERTEMLRVDCSLLWWFEMY